MGYLEVTIAIPINFRRFIDVVTQKARGLRLCFHRAEPGGFLQDLSALPTM